MELFESVFANYQQTRAALHGRAKYEKHPDQVSLKEGLPRLFESFLLAGGRQLADFKVQGSFGNGVIAGVPWVGVFNRRVTESAQNGYYIVLLFSEDMGSCYLSLNQGITQFESQYSHKLAKVKVREAADRALACFEPHPDAIQGHISLAASGHLGQGYEAGAIESFRYDRATPPSEQLIAEHFAVLMAHYDCLIPLARNSLQSLAPVNEAQYQQAVLDKAQGQPSKKRNLVEPAGGIPVSNKSAGVIGGKYARNPSVAAAALEAAKFMCEIDPSHNTFISSSKDLPYVEAHHLVPMGQQGSYNYSLDVTANIVALCPLCHKLLHHAKPRDKKAHLLRLLENRLQQLQEKGIETDAQTLLGYYNKDLLEDEA